MSKDNECQMIKFQSLQAWQAEGIPVATIDKAEELDPEKQLTKKGEEEDKS